MRDVEESLPVASLQMQFRTEEEDLAHETKSEGFHVSQN